MNGDRTQAHPDLIYRLSNTGRALMLDLFVPTGVSSPPLVVFVHGGAFRMGDRTMLSRPLIDLGGFEWLPRHGIAVATVDYRLSSEALWPACVDDVEAALWWLLEHGADFGVDTSRLAVWGESAGGYLALMAGLAVASRVDSVRALIDWYAPINFLTMAAQGAVGTDQADSPESMLLGAPVQTVPDLAAQANPCRRVRADSPPLLVMHGTDDSDVPFAQALELVNAYRAAGAPVDLSVVSGGRHLFRDEKPDPLGATVLRFLQRAFR